ncbi:rhomboid family intramembrane serine protease [Mucilaginibacter limnophilus]|uniref:Rhomboid family intramembrane serine protease n=1 Tax=Mucilaginibacter limnophilus TaxID=1932778 RepID=A0A3S2UMW6_9SPHI|nr:rhomboid family intramembrane serine protease [Mucilaginibacter limnophilus]RVU01614.1 rhomboid family intramembrane serine protease [Mucilaginibacter limnophilus]
MSEYLQIAPVASIIFFFTIITSLYAFYNENALNNMILHPYSVSRKQRLYTLITSGFIHNDWMHLIFNMYSFYIFAFYLETVIGHWQFLVLYMVTLVVSDLPTVYKNRDHYGYRSLGASGAISAVVFSFILFNPTSKMGIVLIPVMIPAYIFGILYLVYCSYASKYSHDRINHDAHLYGALSGIVITIILRPEAVNIFLTELGLRG